MIHMDEGLPFYQAMERTTAYLTENEPVPVAELIAGLPHEEKAMPAAGEGKTGEIAICGESTGVDEAIPAGAVEELAKAAAHVIPGCRNMAGGLETVPQEQDDRESGSGCPGIETISDENQPVPSPMRISLKQRRSQSRMWRQYRR